MEIKKLKPLNGYILVRDNRKEEQTPGGIYIPEKAQDDHIVHGTVITVSGPWINDKGTRQEIRGVAPDDLVLYTFTAGAGNAWEEDGRTYRVIKPIEILAKLVE